MERWEHGTDEATTLTRGRQDKRRGEEEKGGERGGLDRRRGHMEDIAVRGLHNTHSNTTDMRLKTGPAAAPHAERSRHDSI